MTVMATIAPSPGPLSKRFGQTVDAILRRDNIEHWNENKEETNAGEETGIVIVDNVQEEIEDIGDAAVGEDDDVVIIRLARGFTSIR